MNELGIKVHSNLPFHGIEGNPHLPKDLRVAELAEQPEIEEFTHIENSGFSALKLDVQPIVVQWTDADYRGQHGILLYRMPSSP
jgi:hypothetical protein